VIDAARCAHLRHLFYVEHCRIGTIVAELGIHRNTVYRVLASDGWVSAGSPVQPTMLDRDTGRVDQTLEPYPGDGRQLARLEVAP
jgi:hypothetical protein